MTNKRFYGLNGPDVKDFRDFRLSFSLKLVLPHQYNLRNGCSAIMDQGRLGSCVANACVGVMEYNDNQPGIGSAGHTELSRLMLYYIARKEDGNVNEDSGTYLRTAIKCLAKTGTCAECFWPYEIECFNEEPENYCYKDAFNRRIVIYHRIITLFDMKACIASGKPFVLGIPIFSSFESVVPQGQGDCWAITRQLVP